MLWHESESWTPKKDEKHLHALVMAWRRMLWISWTHRKTNIWVRDKAGVKEEGLLCFIKRRKLKSLPSGSEIKQGLRKKVCYVSLREES